MGLHCSHDAFRGAYSAFNRFRQFLCAMLGGSFPPHKYEDGERWSLYDGTFFHFQEGKETERHDVLPEGVLHPEMWYTDDKYSEETYPGLWCLLQHSDCDGAIPPDMCKVLAKELDEIIERHAKRDIPKLAAEILCSAGNHNNVNGGMIEVTRRFAKGCRKASKTKKGLRFQ